MTGKHRKPVGEDQKKIFPDKSGKHKVEEDKTRNTTKPPTEKKDK